MKWSLVAGVIAAVVITAVAFFVFSGGSGPPTYFDDASPVSYFYSAACHYCNLQKTVLEELSKEGFRVKPMDVGANPSYLQEYGIKGTPTFVANNGVRLVGYTQEEELGAWLLAHGAKIR